MAENPRKLFLDYELNASRWWVGFIGNSWLQRRVASYFAWKVNRKYRAYQTGIAIGAEFERKRKFFGRDRWLR